jgi:hypothetical protein
MGVFAWCFRRGTLGTGKTRWHCALVSARADFASSQRPQFQSEWTLDAFRAPVAQPQTRTNPAQAHMGMYTHTLTQNTKKEKTLQFALH